MTQPPTDPAYERFLQGLVEVAEHKKPWRWHGRDQKWYTYDDSAKWILEDAGLADTPPGTALRPDNLGFPTSWTVQKLFVPDLFAALRSAYGKIVAQYPKLANPVWSPWGGGDWRNAIQRAGGPGRQGPIPPELPAAALARIARVRAFEARGDLTADEAAKIVAEIVREYT